MDRRIPRRDFLNGMALGVAGAAVAGGRTAPLEARRAQAPAGDPALSADAAGAARAARLGDRELRRHPRGDFAAAYPSIDTDTSETYDLVIVGGGLSGLAAAYFWHQALPNQRVLILDNHDDFGGHAKRNEFVHDGRTYLAYGGTMSVATPYPYSYMAKQLLVDLGVDVPRNAEFQNRALFEQYQLGAGTFFDKEHFGEDRLVAGTGRPSWPEFFAKAPLSEAARRDLARLYGKNPDYLHGKTVEQKLALLTRISYQEFLLTHAEMSPDALPFFLGQGGRNNKRVDTTPALEAARAGRIGFDGLGLPDEESFRQGSFTFHFPDGNASIARLLVSRLTPKAIPGRHDMATIVKAPPVAYDQLDADGTPTRIRLNSTVARVAVDGHAGAKVAYLRGGKMHQVRAESVVLACFNAMIPKLLPELPVEQQDALAYSVKVPMLYTNVLLRRWTSFKQLGVASINAPGHVPPQHQPRPGLDGRRLPGRDHARPADRRAHGPQPEPAGPAAQGTEPPRPAGTADHVVPRLRAVDPPAVRPDARRHRLRSGRRHRRHGGEPLARRLLLHLRHAGRSRRRPREAAARHRPAPFRPGDHRQLRCRCRRVHQPGLRRGAPRRAGTAGQPRARVAGSSALELPRRS